MKKMITLGFIACASLTGCTTFGMLALKIKKQTKPFFIAPHKKYTNSADIVLMQILTRIEQQITRTEQQNVLLTHQLAATQELNQKITMFIDNMIIDNITETVKKQKTDSPNKLQEMKESPLRDISKYHKEVDAYYKQKETHKKE